MGILALNDPHVATFDTSVTSLSGASLTTVRWPAEASWPEKINRFSALLAEFRPDLVSWQFVPYGFHPKGFTPVIPLRKISELIPSSVIRHAFLHELWIGVSSSDTWRHRILGSLQRRGVLGWLKAWKPSHLATSNPVYCEILRREGLTVELLPLFGNLPVHSRARERDLGEWVIATFGTLHPQWDPRPTATFLFSAASIAKKRLRVLILGRAGRHLSKVEACFCEVTGAAPEVHPDLSPERASLLINAADLGIAPHPWALIGKSGAALAFLENGIPVLVPRDDWQLRRGQTPGPLPEPLLSRLGDLSPSELHLFLQKREIPRSRVNDVCGVFLSCYKLRF